MQFDCDDSGSFELSELMAVAANVAEERPRSPTPVFDEGSGCGDLLGLCFKALKAFYWFVSTNSVQCLLYMTFLLTTKLLTDSMRSYQEYDAAGPARNVRLSDACTHPLTRPTPGHHSSRLPRYYLDKAFNDMFLNNVYDQDLNKFENIRRPLDIYKWGDAVLWSGCALGHRALPRHAPPCQRATCLTKGACIGCHF